MKLFDTNHPFFKPLWIRVAVFAVAAGWGLFEFYIGSTVWGMLFIAFAGVSFYGFFIDFNPREPDQPGAATSAAEKIDGEKTDEQRPD
jgi:hypothetical protein